MQRSSRVVPESGLRGRKDYLADMALFRAWSRGLSRTIEPCLPSPAKSPPAGPDWIHEIKHDGFRIMARRDGRKVRLISRNGHDLTYRFPLAAAAVSTLPVRSC